MIHDFEGQQSNNLSYKAAVDWAVNEGDYLYAFVATGYTGGGLNTFTTSAGGPSPFNDVTDTNYEVGWKRSSWFDGHVRTELAAFYTTYNNFQITLSDPTTPMNTYEINLPKTTTNLRPSKARTQATFGQFLRHRDPRPPEELAGQLLDGRPALQPSWRAAPASRPAAARIPYCVNVKGHPMTYAPSVTYNMSAQYAFDLDNGDTLTPSVNFAHVSGQWASIFDNPGLGDVLGVRDLLGAQLEWKTGTWFWTLYGDNLTDKQYVASKQFRRPLCRHAAPIRYSPVQVLLGGGLHGGRRPVGTVGGRAFSSPHKAHAILRAHGRQIPRPRREVVRRR